MSIELSSRRESIDESVNRLRTYVARYERRYEITSLLMAKDVQKRRVKETAEIARWMNAYAQLRDFETRLSGRTTGTRTKTT